MRHLRIEGYETVFERDLSWYLPSLMPTKSGSLPVLEAAVEMEKEAEPEPERLQALPPGRSGGRIVPRAAVSHHQACR